MNFINKAQVEALSRGREGNPGATAEMARCAHEWLKHEAEGRLMFEPGARELVVSLTLPFAPNAKPWGVSTI